MEDIAPGSTTPNIFVPHYNRPGAIAEKIADINDIANHTEEEMYTPNLMSLVDMGDESQGQLYGYEKIEEAYHKEPEEIIADYRVFRESNVVIDPKKEMYSINNDRLPERVDVSIPNNMKFKHPNPDYNKHPNQVQQTQQNPNYNYYSQAMTHYPQMNQMSNPNNNVGGYTYDSGMNPNIFGWKNSQPPFGSTSTLNPAIAKIILPQFNPATGQGEYVDTNAPNVVDFSNMNSAQTQITNNTIANNMRNPNIQYGANSYNPYQARNNSMWFNRQNAYTGNMYTGSYYGYNSSTPGKSPIQQAFGHLTDFDYKNGIGIKVHVKREGEISKKERDLKKFGHTPEPKRELTYLEKLTQAPKVRVYTYKSEEVDNSEEIVWDKKYMTEQAEAIKKVAQLVPTDEEVKMMEEHPLNLSEEEKKMAYQIADHMEDWDECYADIIRMFVDDFDPSHPMMNWMSQEHFYVFMRLTKGKIKWLQRMNIEDKAHNYHKNYRYLQIPLEKVNPNNPEERSYLYRDQDYYELREVDANGNEYHVVDHGEELPDNVRKAFFNDMVAQIKYRVEAVRQYERCMMIVKLREEKKLNENDSSLDSKQSNSVCGYEIDGSNYGKDKESKNGVNENTYWNNNYNFMSYGARMYYERQEQQRKEHQRMVDNQKMVYRKAFGSSMTEKEFNIFWYGPQNNPDNQLDPVWKRQQELAAITRANIEQLSKARPYPENSNEILNNYELKKIREMDKGCMEKTESLKDYFDNFAYLGSLVEQDENREKEKSKGNVLYRLNQKMKANLGFVNENMEKSVDLLKDNLGIDKSILNKVTQDCFNCLAEDEEGNSYIDLTQNETWNQNRLNFIRKCRNGDQDEMLPRYTPLPF